MKYLASADRIGLTGSFGSEMSSGLKPPNTSPDPGAGEGCAVGPCKDPAMLVVASNAPGCGTAPVSWKLAGSRSPAISAADWYRRSGFFERLRRITRSRYGGTSGGMVTSWFIML